MNLKEKLVVEVQQPSTAMTILQQPMMLQENRGNNQGNHHHNHPLGEVQNGKPEETNPGEIKPAIVTTMPKPPIPTTGAGGLTGGGGIPGGGGGGGLGGYSTGSHDFLLKETRPHLGGGPLNKDKTSSTYGYDLVEQMQYLYVRVVKARDLPVFGGGEVWAEVKLGNYKGITRRVSAGNAEWDPVFAFSKDRIQSSMAEIFVKEKDKGEFLGRVWFDLNEVPRRVPPDSQLAPQWYRMEDKKGDKSKGGEVMVSIWFGTQADETFAEAWHSDQANVHLDSFTYIKSKVYLSPKLWYLRVSIIEAENVILGEKSSSLMRYPELVAKVQVGNKVLRTRYSPPSSTRSLSNPYWNEDLMFVVAEPFEDDVSVSLEDRVGPGREEVVGRVLLPVAAIERRWDDKAVTSGWLNLDNHLTESKGVTGFGRPRIHIRASLDGGYRALDEVPMYCSDPRPTAEQLWNKPHIGMLEVGILGAWGLMPMKNKEGKEGRTDAYCVVKYGQKWVRTRTVVDSLYPRWNEQYTWQVFDPCTVITFVVFDNCRLGQNVANARDSCMGKVRIRLSTLETDRVYTHLYPLVVLDAAGAKKFGELHLAVRFSCANMGNMLHMYALPLLPKMHYVQPLSASHLDSLRHQAMNVVATRLAQAEPPLGGEVVEYMLDDNSHIWSLRRSKAIFFRIMGVLSGLIAIYRWVEAMRSWQRPVYSTLIMIFFLLLVLLPELIIPALLLYAAFVGMWNYRYRPRHPQSMDIRLSQADGVLPDEMDEEFDSFPTSQSSDIVRMRYDRLRTIVGRIQTAVGSMATNGERFLALLSWRDPRATFLFVIICLFAAVGFYAVPRLLLALWGLYALRPPRLRSKLPSQALNFLRRLPSRADGFL